MKSENKDVSLAFDVGHSSIGWAVLESNGIGVKAKAPTIRGCGVVTFGADDCLASKRRVYRRQRRHVRSTRQRIERMEDLLAGLGIFKEAELKARHKQGGGHPAPWLLAGRLLAAEERGLSIEPYLLDWSRLWDVLRWYAHNRGYDGNRRWAGDAGGDDEEEDTQKVANARALMAEHGTATMAETITSVMYQPHGRLKALDVDPAKKLPKFDNRSRYKKHSAAFPREVVEDEARLLLKLHAGHLPHLDEALISLLMDETSEKGTRERLRGMGIRLPKRFDGGLLFGQFVPRFDNRIITTCPVSGQKVCAKAAPEFRRYRWLMQVANVRVVRTGGSLPPDLTKEERAAIHERMEAAGYFTEKQFKDAVRAVTGTKADNLDTMLMHPDAAKALVLDPVKRLTGSERVKPVWDHLPERLQKRAAGKWRHGKVLTLRQMLQWCGETGRSAEDILAKAREGAGEGKAKKKGSAKGSAAGNEDAWLSSTLKAEVTPGRAPYARHILVQAGDEVLAGHDPRRKCRANDPAGGEDKEKDGCLVATDEMMASTMEKPIDHLTNNHLVRHRLLILDRLVKQLVEDATLVPGGAAAIGTVSIEVNRDLKELSGKTAKQVAQDVGRRLGNFNAVVKKLEEAGIHHPTPGLIRKARVAEDLNWTCPYTGRKFGPKELQHAEVWDKDHIIPYSQRPSNGLDALVITTKAVNLAKKNRTALQFIEDMNLPENLAERDRLEVWTPRQYKDFVENLEAWKGHDDDKKRKRRRKQLLLLPKWEEKDAGFLPRDLTVTSHLVRLGAQVVRRQLPNLPPHLITSLPGSVTASMRTGWKLLGALSTANPGVLEADGTLKHKGDIREVTHLHHAVDAVVLGLTNHYFPKKGRLWEALVRRDKQRTPEDNKMLLDTGLFQTTPHGVSFTHQLPSGLEENLREKLSERRVVQHLPAEMSGLSVEENTRGVRPGEHEKQVKLVQKARDPKTGLRVPRKEIELSREKVIGLKPGKLMDQRGARVIVDNYGVAILDEPPTREDGTPGAPEDRFVIIPFSDVWKRLQELRRLNGGKKLLIWRAGQVINVHAGTHAGKWRIFSVKNNKEGKAVSLGAADAVGVRKDKQNVLIRQLVRDGYELGRSTLIG